MTRRYPTVEGCPVPIHEIWTPQSELKERKENRNNHHLCFEARHFGRSILYVVFRNLEVHQQVMQKDVHEWLHQNYGEPEFPTPKQAMNRLEEAFWCEEKLKKHDSKGYHICDFGRDVLDLCMRDYGKYL